MSNADELLEAFHKCKTVWIPRWFKEFSDDKGGGFHERLGADGQPLSLPKRLLTQCRQIIVYSNYCQESPNQVMEKKVKDSFAFLLGKYRSRQTKGFHFSINSKGIVEDATYDLYGHAFVLLACAAMYKAFANPEALIVARETLNFIDKNFRLPNAPGLAEALDANLRPLRRTRRQNPHMHMMEACVYMHDASQDPAYLTMAGEMLGIFKTYLFNRTDSTIREYFDDQMGMHPKEGHIIEAGHHSEWVWLLARYQETSAAQDPALLETMKKLFHRVAESGFDPENGGIYNSQHPDGTPVDEQKRIWPVLETLRAATIMSNVDGEQEMSRAVLDTTLELLKLYIKDDGVWTEFMSRDLRPATNYRPGTTPYHIFPPLLEGRKYISTAPLLKAAI